MQIKIKKTLIFDIVAASLVFAFVLENVSDQAFQTLRYVELFLGAILLIYDFAHCRKREVWIVFCVLLACGVVNWLIIGSFYLPLLQKYFICYFSLGIYFYHRYELKRWVYFGCAFAIAALVMAYWFKSSDNYMLFYKTSRNYVSVFLLVSFFLLYLLAEKRKKIVPIYIPVLYFLACVSAVGRSGIIASFIMLISFMVYRTFRNEQNRRNKWKTVKVLLFYIALVSAFIILMNNFEYIISTYFYRFSSSDLSDRTNSNSVRLLVLTQYWWSILSPKYLFLGANPETISSQLLRVNGNLHNSFLQFHSLFGLIGFILLIVVVIETTRYFIKQKNAQGIIMFSGFLIRSFFDINFGGYIGDVIMTYFIVCSMSRILKRKKPNESKGR